jgi:hypothetical protein
MDVVLTPEQYQAKGQVAIQANTDAINALKANKAAIAKDPSVPPMTDKQYPHWSDRYDKNRNNNGEDDDFQPIEISQDLEAILEKFNLDAKADWKYVELTSKGQTDNSKPTIIAMVPNGGNGDTVIVTHAISSYDVDPAAVAGQPVPQRLNSFELAWQIWKDEAGDNAGNLEYFIHVPVAQAGSKVTLENIQSGLDLSPTQLTQIQPGNIGYIRLLGTYWSRINGLDNTKGAQYALADHVVTLNGKQIATIWESPQLPSDSGAGIIVMQLG